MSYAHHYIDSVLVALTERKLFSETACSGRVSQDRNNARTRGREQPPTSVRFVRAMTRNIAPHLASVIDGEFPRRLRELYWRVGLALAAHVDQLALVRLAGETSRVFT